MNKQTLSNHNLFIRHIRYVDSLIFGDSRLKDLTPYDVLLDDGFYGKPIILETEPDQEFLGFMLETKPFELIYQGPTNVSQVLSPFSASPPQVLLSGFRSRCHIVVKGAFPDIRVKQGLDQLIRLYTLAGFPKLLTISHQIMTQHQNLQPREQKACKVFMTMTRHPWMRKLTSHTSCRTAVDFSLVPTSSRISQLFFPFPTWIMLKGAPFTITWPGPSCI